MSIKKCIALILITINLFYLSCESSDDNPNPNPDGETPSGSSVNFEEALFETFTLSEIDEHHNKDTSIKNPKLTNGIPQEKGKITIELDYTTITKFSLKAVGFKTSDFTISPKVGEQSIVAGEMITYTIRSTKDDSVLLQYDVLVTVKDIVIDPADEKISISKISFLKAKNEGFDEDVSTTDIRKRNFGNFNSSVTALAVPDGTDFSKLVATVDFEGSYITYHTDINGDHADFKELKEDTVLNFKYPNRVFFRVYNSDKSKYHEYYVYVDIKNPIVFDESSVTINDGKPVSRTNTFNNVIGFTNQGNYPITHSRVIAHNIEVTKTPEKDPINYYSHISLRGDNDIHTGEKGRLYIQTNFPGNLIWATPSPYNPGITTYTVNVQFRTMFNYEKIITYNPNSAINGSDFYLYDPVEIEVKASVFALNN
ncbi:hypothetical protein [Flavivirga eckloniae]|uniref:DUF4959 domain-containing protein n=1 Tax=Flavivirga eckloniae TaxID=1803846 RepID=A0A2K9PLC9_9FLAO|nr:hypothetical protein [Flavivirga eckloniae]AUP77387.1 hypothetical protein C1H87_01085 [Flavivirga eckloniae]